MSITVVLASSKTRKYLSGINPTTYSADPSKAKVFNFGEMNRALAHVSAADRGDIVVKSSRDKGFTAPTASKAATSKTASSHGGLLGPPARGPDKPEVEDEKVELKPSYRYRAPGGPAPEEEEEAPPPEE